jgi:hypothetical protein
MENPDCIYCGETVALNGNYIAFTDSGDWLGHAHPECQEVAETLAIEALCPSMRVTRSVSIPTC